MKLPSTFKDDMSFIFDIYQKKLKKKEFIFHTIRCFSIRYEFFCSISKEDLLVIGRCSPKFLCRDPFFNEKGAVN